MIYRVYFNRSQDFPQVWSVDEGTADTEINVVGIRIDGCRVASRLISSAVERQPMAWFEVEATMTLVSGVAVFTA